MDFSDALREIKAGRRCARDSWGSLTVGQYVQLARGGGEQLPYLEIRTSDGLLVPWQPPHKDVLAEDWAIYHTP